MNIVLVAPTIGEAVQCPQVCKAVKRVFKKAHFFALVQNEDAYAVLRRSKDMDAVSFYKKDSLKNAREILNSKKPDMAIFIENCSFPYLLLAAKKMNAVNLLISAAMNKAILHHPRYKKCFLLGRYKAFSYIGVKSGDYINDFIRLGVEKEKLFVSGDFKIDGSRLRLSKPKRDYYIKALGLKSKKTFVAGSLSKREGKCILEICKRLFESFADINCILAPRFLDNLADFKEYAHKLSLSFTTRSEAVNIARNKPRITFLDTYGELGQIYGLADAVFVGGTLKPLKNKPLGQNILEPLFHARPIVVGPNVKKDSAMVQKLRKFWKGVSVKDSNGLYESIASLLSNSDLKSRYSTFIKKHINLENTISGTVTKLKEIKYAAAM